MGARGGAGSQLELAALFQGLRKLGYGNHFQTLDGLARCVSLRHHSPRKTMGHCLAQAFLAVIDRANLPTETNLTKRDRSAMCCSS